MSEKLLTKKEISEGLDKAISELETVNNYKLENNKNIHNCRMIVIDHAMTCSPDNALAIAKEILRNDINTIGKYLSDCKSLVDKIVENKLCSSKEEAVELIRSGEISVNDLQINPEDVDIEIPDFLYKKIEIGSSKVWVKECGNAQQ